MPSHRVLHEHTQDGAAAIDEFPERVEGAKEIARSMDCAVEDVYLTNGRYDLAVDVEAPDDLRAKRLAAALTSRGSATTEFQRAFTPEETVEFVEGLPGGAPTG